MRGRPMSEMSNIGLGAIILRPRCAGEPDVRERLRKAMRHVADIEWLGLPEDEQFRSAIAAALVEAPPDQQALISRSLAPLKALNAAIQGVPVDCEAVFAATAGDELPLLALWREVRGERSAGR